MAGSFVLPPVEQRPEWVREYVEPADLAGEPEDVKALRLLRMFRAFLNADERIMMMELDGVPLMFGKVNPSAIRRGTEAEVAG